MIDIGAITKAVQDLLTAKTNGYTITRNRRRNSDPNVAARGKGWIGIYRGERSYTAHSLGSRPWLVAIDVVIEIQYAHMDNERVENNLMDAENEILGVINSNRTLSGTVAMVNGIDITDELNESDESTYWQTTIITIHAEVRA